jgi:hypothetical protein
MRCFPNGRKSVTFFIKLMYRALFWSSKRSPDGFLGRTSTRIALLQWGCPQITQIHPSPRPLPPHPNPVSVKADVECVTPSQAGEDVVGLACAVAADHRSSEQARWWREALLWPPAGSPRWSRGRQLPQRRARKEHVKRMGCLRSLHSRLLRALGAGRPGATSHQKSTLKSSIPEQASGRGHPTEDGWVCSTGFSLRQRPGSNGRPPT